MQNNDPCPMPISVKIKTSSTEFAKGEVKSFIFWKLVTIVFTAYGSWQAIPVVKSMIVENQAGYGLFVCTRGNKVTHEQDYHNCPKGSSVTFKSFKELQ